MKYLELEFEIAPYGHDAADLLMALAAEAGLESFVDTERGCKGYAQVSAFDRHALDALLAAFPMDDVRIRYSVRQAEDRNWNEEWERNGFGTVEVAGRIAIHKAETDMGRPVEYNIIINPRQAFGTGTHQTTCMILEMLLEQDLQGATVVDAGCGTGILGIFCAKKGATRVLGYDVDNWSVENTTDNLQLNGITAMEVLEGDSAVLQGKGLFDWVLANINRNILLADLPAFRASLRPGGHLLLSGFYTADAPLLIEQAATLGLACVGQKEKDDWAALLFQA